MSRLFQLNKDIYVVARSEKTRSGFRHRATLYKKGMAKESTTIAYYNRTWEAYEFQSVLLKIIEKTSSLTRQQKTRLRNKFR